MREIKFRQWIANRKRMHMGIGMVKIDGHWAGPPSVNFSTDPLMQFTGLKDKNGKEIYEGDVIEYNYPDDYERGEIMYLSGAFYYLCEDGSRDLLSDCQLPEMPIIGNIYENPELVSA